MRTKQLIEILALALAEERQEAENRFDRDMRLYPDMLGTYKDAVDIVDSLLGKILLKVEQLQKESTT